MEEINEDGLKELVNKLVKVEKGNRLYVGKLIDVGNKQIKLRIVSKQKSGQIISMYIEEIDAIMFKIPTKNVGY